MALSDFAQRLLGFPAQLFDGQSSNPINAANPSAAALAQPTMQQLQQQDMQDAGMQRIGQLGMILMAAGQRMTPRERATILAQAPQYMDGMQRDAMTAAQARLMNMQGRAAQDELTRTEALRQKSNDPSYLNSIGLSPEQAQSLGPAGIQKLLENQALANTPEAALDRRYKQAQIDHLLNPTPATPQMVDLPDGGKGWATPGSSNILPIGGAGKGGADPTTVKRLEAEDKNLTYAKEAISANRVLSDPAYSGELTDGYKNRVNMIPTLEGSWAGEKYLTGDSQANSFVDSVIRPRSGAKVDAKEETDKKRLFTPMPGDSQERLYQKAQMRANHINSLIAGSNPADRPMLIKMFQDSEQELLNSYQGAPGNQQQSMPGVKSIRQIQ